MKLIPIDREDPNGAKNAIFIENPAEFFTTKIAKRGWEYWKEDAAVFFYKGKFIFTETGHVSADGANAKEVGIYHEHETWDELQQTLTEEQRWHDFENKSDKIFETTETTIATSAINKDYCRFRTANGRIYTAWCKRYQDGKTHKNSLFNTDIYHLVIFTEYHNRKKKRFYFNVPIANFYRGEWHKGNPDSNPTLNAIFYKAYYEFLGAGKNKWNNELIHLHN